MNEGFAAAVEALGIALCETVPILSDPLPDDPTALIESQAIAASLRHAIAEAALALAPKVSVVVDGDGRIGLDAVPAETWKRCQVLFLCSPGNPTGAVLSLDFLRHALAFYARHGIRVERVMTENGSAYRAAIHELACRVLGVRHLRTRAYRPQTNGKAERFIRTMLGGWAYGAIYASSTERTAALDGWLWTYNHRRRHSAIGRQPPISRLNNLLGSYT